MKIDGALSRSAVERLVAKPLDMSVIAAAHGVFQLASATMTRAVKAVSTFRGRDPRDFALFAFGGNGALMAASIADALEIRSVIVPRFAGVFSALGLLDANLERDMSRTWMQSLDQLDGVELEQRYADIESELRKAYAASHGAAGLSLRRTADLRYRGQAFELNVMAPQTGSNAGAVLRERFVSEHRRTYGHGSADDPIDLVNIRVTATLPVERRPDAVHSIGRSNSGSVHRDAFFGAKLGLMSTRILRRANLSTRQPGPLIIEEDDATVLVPPHWSAELGADAAILMNRNMS
jgi:N-methylhydantoinase A